MLPDGSQGQMVHRANARIRQTVTIFISKRCFLRGRGGIDMALLSCDQRYIVKRIMVDLTSKMMLSILISRD